MVQSMNWCMVKLVSPRIAKVQNEPNHRLKPSTPTAGKEIADPEV
jgi:hypothetical protein